MVAETISSELGNIARFENSGELMLFAALSFPSPALLVFYLGSLHTSILFTPTIISHIIDASFLMVPATALPWLIRMSASSSFVMISSGEITFIGHSALLAMFGHKYIT